MARRAEEGRPERAEEEPAPAAPRPGAPAGLPSVFATALGTSSRHLERSAPRAVSVRTCRACGAPRADDREQRCRYCGGPLFEEAG